MKRFFFTVIALATVVVSCTKSGLIESPQTYETPISFEPYSGKAPVTKATIENETSLKNATTGGFHVTGFVEGTNGAIVTSASTEVPVPYYLDKDVFWGTPEGATSETWYYDEAKYWPEGETLSFVAYGLGVNKGAEGEIFEKETDDAGNVNYAKFTYEVPTTVANQRDLVISPIMTGKSKASNNGTIAVQLYHVLSRVGFKVKPQGDAGVNLVIKSVKLNGNFVEGATFDLKDAVTVTTTTDNTATPPTTTTTVEYAKTPNNPSTAVVSYDLFGNGYTKGAATSTNTHGFVTTSVASATAVPIYYNCDFVLGENYEAGDETATSGASDADRFMMIIPQTISGATVDVIYQLEDDIERTASIKIGDATNNSFEFKAGKAYEFVFTISTTAVGFNVQVGQWDTDLDGDKADDDDIIPDITPVN